MVGRGGRVKAELQNEEAIARAAAKREAAIEEAYDRLRPLSPGKHPMKAELNQQYGPFRDPAYDIDITGTYDLDHVIPLREVVEMPGFLDLTPSNQLAVANLPENLVRMSPATNRSRGDLRFSEWIDKGHSQLGPVLSATRRRTLLNLERDAFRSVRGAIDYRLRLQSVGN